MSTTAFLNQLYTNCFNRAPDQIGLEGWSSVIDSGALNSAEVCSAFIASTEFQTITAPIIKLYMAAFNRLPETEGLKAWIDVAQNGVSLDDIAESFINSAEFKALHPDMNSGEQLINTISQGQFSNPTVTDSLSLQQKTQTGDNGSLSQTLLAVIENQAFVENNAEILQLQSTWLSVNGEIPTTEMLSQVQPESDIVPLITQLYAADAYSGPSVPGLSQSGVAVDGYIKGATITMYLPNGETRTTITDDEGNFDFGTEAGFGRLVMTGGTDISTGAPFEGNMTAPAGATVVNPITTLIDNYATVSGKSPDVAQRKVLNKLGLNKNLDAINFDPMYEASRTDTNAATLEEAIAMQSAATQINTMATQVAALLEGAGAADSEADGAEAAMQALAGRIDSPGKVKLTEASTITELTSNAAVKANADAGSKAKVDSLSSDASETIANLNSAIDNAAGKLDAASANSFDVLKEIAQVQLVAEEIEDNLEAGAQNGDITDAKNKTQGTQLDQAIAAEADNINVVEGVGAVLNETPPPPAPDRTAPTITTVAISQTSGLQNDRLNAGDVVTITLAMSESVYVTGTPQLTLSIGNTPVQADYSADSAGSNLIFSYEIQAGDTAPDGISIEADSLQLNGGTIKDGAGNDAELTHEALAQQSNLKVDTTSPSISSLSITSLTGSDNAYKTGDTIQLTLNASEALLVTGTPQVNINIGGQSVQADYISGSGTDSLIFEYTLVAGLEDTNGISTASNSLILNGGDITDSAGNALDLQHDAIADDNTQAVDSITPSVNSVSISSNSGANQTYGVGAQITFAVEFSETVKVTGTPQLAVELGGNTVYASYSEGSDSNTLTFSYSVLMGEVDSDGISVTADSLGLNGGTISDNAGNSATLSHTEIAVDSSHKVNGTAPTVSSVSIISTPADSLGYISGEVIQVRVTLDKTVDVTGSPQLQLTLGSSTVNAIYDSGSGSNQLVFEYQVQSGDLDSDGIAISANSLSLNGGTIEDSSGNSALLNHLLLADDSAQKVDGEAPEVNSVSFTSNAGGDGTYQPGDTVQVTVTFSETVRVTGSPQLQLQMGSETVQAGYSTGDNSNQLVFEYVIQANDHDTNGISVNANTLTLNGGTIVDLAGNNAQLDHSTVNDNSNHQVDALVPDVTSLSISSSAGPDSTYIAGDTIQITVNFSEDVTVSGTPQLGFTAGSSTLQAAYTNGTGTSSLVFSYTVQPGQGDGDGISIQSNSLQLNGGTIVDSDGQNASLTHSALGNQASHKIDTAAPVFTSGNSASVNENVSTTEAVYTAIATDDGTINWALAGNGADNALFNIDSSSGELTFISSPDYENAADANGDNVYEVTIQATDAVGNDSEQAVSITVEDEVFGNLGRHNGINLNLINPLTAASGKTYYFLDNSNDGRSGDNVQDKTTHSNLDALLNGGDDTIDTQLSGHDGSDDERSVVFTVDNVDYAIILPTQAELEILQSDNTIDPGANWMPQSYHPWYWASTKGPQFGHMNVPIPNHDQSWDTFDHQYQYVIFQVIELVG